MCNRILLMGILHLTFLSNDSPLIILSPLVELHFPEQLTFILHSRCFPLDPKMSTLQLLPSFLLKSSFWKKWCIFLPIYPSTWLNMACSGKKSSIFSQPNTQLPFHFRVFLVSLLHLLLLMI